MKPIKFLSIIFFTTAFIFACKPKNQAANKLSESSKEFFEIKNGSEFIFGLTSDTGYSLKYTSSNFINNQANPDIENNEIMTYDLTLNNFPTFTVRTEAGGTQYKDRIAILTKFKDTLTVGPVLFNLNGNFEPQPGTFDSVFQYPTYTIGTRTYNNVLRVKMSNHAKYKQMVFAKKLGIISYTNKQDLTYFVKNYSLK